MDLFRTLWPPPLGHGENSVQFETTQSLLQGYLTLFDARDETETPGEESVTTTSMMYTAFTVRAESSTRMTSLVEGCETKGEPCTSIRLYRHEKV